MPADATDALCGLVVKQLCGDDIDYGVLSKVVKTGGLSNGDAKGVLAALNFILSNASKYGVSESELHTETQQLGLTKDAADKIAERYTAHCADLVAVKTTNTLRLDSPGRLQWRVDCVLGSSTGKISGDGGSDGSGISVQMKMGGAPAFEVNAEMFRLFHSELAAAKEQMDAFG